MRMSDKGVVFQIVLIEFDLHRYWELVAAA